ncbi:regulator of cell morphogenesis and NO signaling [Fictibacillus solisalsi]|uniref:Regulator of cell morphogenesis and NO signaling n=1 Tax=Fictibacillus solisalsi TaxID=459525 RepID=A0A1G9TUS3_9BACL|nr:iron-sulfur cluster repair di-iron protein [Fictibacillus solisalsi]SDM51466.1 regulator of cell morphogenesis and NO signaling [Fictibacillus solisalsi]
MKSVFDPTVETRKVVMKCPRAGDLLKNYRIDYVQNGSKPIGEAINERSLNSIDVMNELNTLYEKNRDNQRGMTKWEKQKVNALIQYIIDAHHSYLYMVLPKLQSMITTIFNKHVGTHPELSHVHYLFSILKIELEQHILIEEELIFPKILAYEKKPTLNALIDIKEFVEDLKREHEHISQFLKDMREFTNDYKAPDDACETYRLAYVKLDELESDLFQHLHLENNLLFPRVIG